MKKRIPSFIAGMLTTVLIGSLGVGALAATGQMTITVDPINIQVNGATFQPKDAQGNDVPVFAYNGTTYAPLRALAEAYGLEVGYDQGANMATVKAPQATTDPNTTTAPAPDTTASNDYSDWSAEEEAAYQEFKGMWEVNQESTNINTALPYIGLECAEQNQLLGFLKGHADSEVTAFSLRCTFEIGQQMLPSSSGTVYYELSDGTTLWRDDYYEVESIIDGSKVRSHSLYPHSDVLGKLDG